MEARQWRVFLCVRGTVGFFGSFRRLSKALFFRDWCIHSVVSLTASHDSRWNAKNTVEGFSRLPFSVFLPSPFPSSSPPLASSPSLSFFDTVASAIAQTARLFSLLRDSRNSRSSQDDDPFSSQVCQPRKKENPFR